MVVRKPICHHAIRAVCFGLVLTTSLPAQGQSLREAVMISLSQYPAILAAQSRAQAAQSDITRAQAAHWPQVSWLGTYSDYNAGGVDNTWIQSPTVSLNVWSGWRIQADVERSQAMADSAREQQKITRDDIALQCIEGYLNWAYQIEMVKLAEENLTFHRRVLGSTETILQADKGRRVDRNQAMVRYQNAKLILAQRQGDLAQAADRLSRMLMGQMPSAPSGLTDEPGVTPKSVQLALASMDANHPVLLQQQAMVAANEAALRGARSGHSPTVDFTYGKQTYQGSGQGDYVAQLVVSVPIFQGGATMGAVSTAAANLAASEQNLKETRLVLRERIQSFWAQRQSAIERIAASHTQIKTAKAVVVAYRQQFEVGRRSLLDLLNIQSDLFSYQSNRASAEFDAKIARARLMAATGQLAKAYLSSSEPTLHSRPNPTLSKTQGATTPTSGKQTPSSASTGTGLRSAQVAPASGNWMNTQ
ncbi:TolC family protein [Orrella daihaiensis]|uniref:TolC family protein n=1 Tax=Orrella daihaiensis TaxID=2782176 RepID=A0ABY4AP17_9BURK|nr:TolC family protein [Orrella daihaiensis]UOD49789.1 TolC family protein [Orrella daihaiensis]